MRYSKNKVICKQPSATIFLGQEKTTGIYAALKEFQPGFQHAFQHQFHVLQRMQGHPNIIQLIAVDPDRKVIIQQCMYENILQLYTLSKQGTNEVQTACILLQGALALHHLHSQRFIHRDVKPQNLMFERSSNLLKVIDFGWTTKIQNAKTHQCCTRWYQAPESLLQLGGYSTCLDIFGLGCSVAQFFQTKALFEGECRFSQLYKIFQMLGLPNNISWPEGSKKIEQLGLNFQINQVKTLQYEFSKQNKTASPGLISLLYQMLEINPSKRITAIQIIKHPYFQNLQGFSPQQHLPPQVFKVYEKYVSQESSMVKPIPLGQIININNPLVNLKKINGNKRSNEYCENNILQSIMRKI